MGVVTFPTAIAFDGYDRAMTKEQALKVLEESAELVEAVKDRDKHGCAFGRRSRILDEAMDVYQALANLLAGVFTDEEIADAYERCLDRNRERGRL